MLNCPGAPRPTEGILAMTGDDAWMPRTESIRKVHSCTSAAWRAVSKSLPPEGCTPPSIHSRAQEKGWEAVPAQAELRDTGPGVSAGLLL